VVLWDKQALEDPDSAGSDRNK